MIDIEPSDYISFDAQRKHLLSSKKRKSLHRIKILGMNISVFPKVYSTGEDSKLIAKTVRIKKTETFLEIGTGCGVVSIYLSKKAREGLGVDINPQAVKNAKYNAKKLCITNVSFAKSDLFSNVKGKYDVIIFNPPYSACRSKDLTDRMFWDTKNKTKARFFREVKKYLNPDGRIYFGWANFKDLDVNLPIRLAESAGFKITKISEKSNNNFSFFVFEILHSTG